MAQSIKWSPEALEDLEHHAGFIERDSPHYATAVVTKIVDSIEECGVHPEIGRKVPEINDPEFRERIVYRYRVIYRNTDKQILVVAIIHGSQDFLLHVSRIVGDSET